MVVAPKKTLFARCSLLLGLVAAGCGLTHTVDRDLLQTISVEYKLSLFDAENEVSIAVDERDRLQREILQVKEDLARVERQIVDAESDYQRAVEKGVQDRARLAEQAAAVYELKAEYLEEHIDYLREELRVQDAFINVALAKFELAKAQLVKKNNVRGADSIDLADFEAQVSDAVAAAKEAKDSLNVDFAEVEKAKNTWLAARDELSKASGGGVGSAWAEDDGLWGSR